MGADDDHDCPEHIWQLSEAHLSARGAEMVDTCVRCGAVAFDPSASDEPGRPKL